MKDSTCSRCGGQYVRDLDEANNYEYICLQCGHSPRIINLGVWLARQERPTEQFYKAHGKTPPTRIYE